MIFYNSGQVIQKTNLPRLVVLTGLNASGKTQGMKALQQADPDGSAYIDYQAFAAQWNASTYEGKNLSHDKDGIVLEQNISDWMTNYIPGAPSFRFELFEAMNDQQKLTWLNTQQENSNFARLAWKFFELFPAAESSPFESHSSFLSQHTTAAKNYWSNFGDDLLPTALKEAGKKTGKPAHQLSKAEIVESLDKLQRLKHPIYLNFTELVTDFVNKRKAFYFSEWQERKCFSESTDTFLATHEDPISRINSILKILSKNKPGDFQFIVSTNVPSEIKSLKDLELPSEITIQLKENETGNPREISQVSSGERALLALATLLYTHRHIQPLRTLYLDEIDASLHPTMIQSMLDILSEQVGETRIFLATHSPSTVALAPEESLFLVDGQKASKTSKSIALESLTQGYFTTDGVAAILRSVRGISKKIIVVSEGKNHEYLRSIFIFLGIDQKIHLHSWSNFGSKGTSGLKTLMELFAEMVTQGQNKIIFVYDCDVDRIRDKHIRDTDWVAGVYLPKLPNPAQRGIENIVPETVLKQLGADIYGTKGGEKTILDEHKQAVQEKFIEAIRNNEIDRIYLEKAMRDLLNHVI